MNDKIKTGIKLAMLLMGLIRISGDVHAQPTLTTADEYYSAAREKAFNGSRIEARILCKEALKRSPGYEEIRVFYARTCYWDELYDSALIELKPLAGESTGHIEAALLLSEVYEATGKRAEAHQLLDTYLRDHPNHPDLLTQKAILLNADHREKESVVMLLHAIETNPGCRTCIKAFERIRGGQLKHTLSVNTEGSYFSKYFDPMYFASVQLSGLTSRGTWVGRLNYSQRFGTNGIQVEGDAYPALWKGAYGYLNYGYSASSLFSPHRFGVEVFQSLPRSFEASLGMRDLIFSSGPILIYTGSVGFYTGNYWLNLRSYLTPSTTGTSNSYNFTVRKYFSDANNYLSLLAGTGFSPDARRIQTNDGQSSLNNIYYLRSQKVELGGQWALRYNLLFTVNGMVSRQQTSFTAGAYIYNTSIQAGIKIRI